MQAMGMARMKSSKNWRDKLIGRASALALDRKPTLAAPRCTQVAPVPLLAYFLNLASLDVRTLLLKTGCAISLQIPILPGSGRSGCELNRRHDYRRSSLHPTIIWMK